MPFGWNVSSQIIQKKFIQCLNGITVIHCVDDDMMITVRGETEEDTLVDHGNNLIALMKRCSDVGIRLNHDKIILRQDHVPFLDHTLTADRLKPDPDEVTAIDDMSQHIDIEGVQWIYDL